MPTRGAILCVQKANAGTDGAMRTISVDKMRSYLGKSISSMNRNKLNGLLAEVEFRSYLSSLGYSDRVSPGGWIFRSQGEGNFGHHTAVIFPENIQPETDYSSRPPFPEPHDGLHSICNVFHSVGIKSYYAASKVEVMDDPLSIDWYLKQLGVPTSQPWNKFPEPVEGFNNRARKYSFLRYRSDVSDVPEVAISEEFTKEHLRVTFQTALLCEVSDVDGILWGNQRTYPIEIKEKTAGHDKKRGHYFGLDFGPFVKLAFYAAKRGNLHSIFVVREIDDPTSRNLVDWWYIPFEHLAMFASWTFLGGGTAMTGGRSATTLIPKSEFRRLTASELSSL